MAYLSLLSSLRLIRAGMRLEWFNLSSGVCARVRAVCVRCMCARVCFVFDCAFTIKHGGIFTYECVWALPDESICALRDSRCTHSVHACLHPLSHTSALSFTPVRSLFTCLPCSTRTHKHACALTHNPLPASGWFSRGSQRILKSVLKPVY